MVWTHARAFGGASVDYFRGAGEGIRTDRVSWGVRILRWLAAVGMLLLSFLAVTSAQVRRGVYSTADRRALVVVLPHSRPRTFGALLAIVMTLAGTVFAAFFGMIALAYAVQSPVPIYVASAVLPSIGWAVGVFLAVGAALQLLPAWLSGSTKDSIGPETPEGDRWVVESLAARSAADGSAAFRLASRVLRAFPPGRVLAAGARTDALRAGYERLGFTAGDDNRVYLET
ncbi:hypothetical protein [Microbacterium paraoxydans]|uniref:hypothetical protein n=1 Tax=Microbacterium paraoxydans TaxID=199592 RepID=UPI0013B40916|nr:hypothetical protein [Microbacterium paraoxydans]